MPNSPLSSYDTKRVTLGDALRRARRARGLTGIQLSGFIKERFDQTFSQSKISKIENLAVTPSSDDIDLLITALEPAPELEREIRELSEDLANDIASWEGLQRKGSAGHQGDIMRLESESTDIAVCQSALIPGLLQSAAYASEIMSRVVSNHRDLDAAVAARLARQQLLDIERKRFEFLIAEWVLRIPVVEPAEMVFQCERLLSASKRENVNIGILPLGADPGTPFLTPFAIFDEGTVVVESLTDELVIRRKTDVTKYREALEQLRSASVFGDAGVQLLLEYRASWAEKAGEN